MSMFFFFFFQAEDGIRDGRVTGVQTCALPICHHPREAGRWPPCYDELWTRLLTAERHAWMVAVVALGREFGHEALRVAIATARSEERRVGKEGRCRGGPDH